MPTNSKSVGRLLIPALLLFFAVASQGAPAADEQPPARAPQEAAEARGPAPDSGAETSLSPRVWSSPFDGLQGATEPKTCSEAAPLGDASAAMSACASCFPVPRCNPGCAGCPNGGCSVGSVNICC